MDNSARRLSIFKTGAPSDPRWAGSIPSASAKGLLTCVNEPHPPRMGILRRRGRLVGDQVSILDRSVHDALLSEGASLASLIGASRGHKYRVDSLIRFKARQS
jgi:hypothetical protein